MKYICVYIKTWPKGIFGFSMVGLLVVVLVSNDIYDWKGAKRSCFFLFNEQAKKKKKRMKYI